MKTKLIVTIAVVAFLPVSGFAQTPPAPPAPPIPPDRHEHRHGRMPKVPVIFLGVETSEVPSVVSEQLGLAKGFGLVVDYVVPDGPAAAAGIQQNDILKMLNDQILIDPGQLRKLLQTFQEGSSVSISLLRKGQEQKVTVKLTKKEVPQRHGMFGDQNEWKNGWNFDFGDMDLGNVDLGNLKERLQDLKEQIKEQVGEQSGVIRDAVMQAHEEVRRARDEARRAADEARHSGKINMLSSRDGALKATNIDLGKAQIVFSDDKGEMKLESVDGKKMLTAKDPQGKLLFSGPIETKEDLDKIPAEVRQRYDKLQQNDLPAVTPRADADEDESDDMDDESDDRPSINQV